MYYSYAFKNGVKQTCIDWECDMWVNTKTLEDCYPAQDGESKILYLTEWFIENLSKDNPYINVAESEDEEVNGYHVTLDVYREIKKGIDYFCPDVIKNWGGQEVELSNLQENDVLIFRVQEEINNHCGVYLGNDIFYHHAVNRLSCRENLYPFWHQYLVGGYRYVA